MTLEETKKIGHYGERTMHMWRQCLKNTKYGLTKKSCYGQRLAILKA